VLLEEGAKEGEALPEEAPEEEKEAEPLADTVEELEGVALELMLPLTLEDVLMDMLELTVAHSEDVPDSEALDESEAEWEEELQPVDDTDAEAVWDEVLQPVVDTDAEADGEPEGLRLLLTLLLVLLDILALTVAQPVETSEKEALEETEAD
jgi:hypothetical protein